MLPTTSISASSHMAFDAVLSLYDGEPLADPTPTGRLLELCNTVPLLDLILASLLARFANTCMLQPHPIGTQLKDTSLLTRYTFLRHIIPDLF